MKMSEERKTLLQGLKDTFIQFKGRNSVGRMRTEHSVFIPASYLQDQSEETAEFIVAAKAINNRAEWGCPIKAEMKTFGSVKGVDFIFAFSPSTDFDAIIAEVESRLNQK